jgi:hypothetical protein
MPMIMKRIPSRLAAAVGTILFIAGLVNAMDYDAAGMMPSAPPHLRSGQQEIGHTLEGEVVRIDGEYYFVADPNGNEVRLTVNQSTLRTGPIKEGELVEARVNNDDHALSIRPIKALEAGPADAASSREGK